MSFNPEEVFSSVQAFLSSGYVMLAAVILLGFSVLKKLLSLAITGVLIFLIWFFCQDQIVAALQSFFTYAETFVR